MLKPGYSVSAYKLAALVSAVCPLAAQAQTSYETSANACGGQELVAASDDRYISAYDLMGLSLAELGLARNEIYARHGYVFTGTSGAADWFASCDWYVPGEDATANGEIELSHIEQANVRAIQKTESRRDDDMTAIASIPPAQTPWSAIWVSKMGDGTETRYDALFAKGKLRLEPIVPDGSPMGGIEAENGEMIMPPLIRLYDFGAGTYGADELNDFEVTNEILGFWPNLEWGIREWAVDAPGMLFPVTLVNLSVAVTSEEVTEFNGEEGVTRYTLQSGEPPAWSEESLSGDIWVTADGIIIAADLSGRKPLQGEMDQYTDWSTDYHLENLERLESYEAEKLEMPTLVDGKQWLAPG